MHKFQGTAAAPAIVVSQERIQRSMLPARPSLKRSSELSAALARCCHALIGIGVFRAAIDLLQLTGPLFMLEVYDRVLRGRSVPTLVAISALALLMFAFQGMLDVLRSRVLVRIAAFCFVFHPLIRWATRSAA